jgi:hypothetical protein
MMFVVNVVLNFEEEGGQGHLNEKVYQILKGDRRDLNPRHPGSQPGALPTELRSP